MNETLNFTLPFSNPVMIFALVMLIILLAPILVRKIKVPGLVGIILAGTIVGPSILGLLERDSTIELLGTVGLLYLMFMAGLSIDLNRFEKLRNQSIGFGTISYIFPAVGAYFAGIHLLNYSVESSLLLGAIVGSHTLLAYPIIERLGITKNTAVTMSMGGTLVTDTLSLGILAVIAGTVGENQGAGYWTAFAISIGVFLTAAIIILPRLGRWFFRNMKHDTYVDFVFMMAVLFSTAFLAELAGLASIIGAFIAGLLLNRLVPMSGTLMNRIQFVGNSMFIPFFLISVGMLVDVQVLASLEVWLIAILFTALVFVGKGVSSLIVKLIKGFSNAEGYVIFGLTTPQSAATLAVTLLGFDLGFFNHTAVNAVVILILITCLVGPWLVEKYGRDVAIQEEKKPYEPSESPQRILVPLANPETSDTLMDIAFMIRDEKSAQPVFPLTVARDGKDVEAQVAKGEKMLSHAVIHAAAAEVPVNPVTTVDYNIANGIARAVSENLGSVVIIGWNGTTSTKSRIFGSILDQLLLEIDEMVMVSRISKPISTHTRILIAVPPFASTESGFSGAIRSLKLMAEQTGDQLVFVMTSERKEYVQKRIEKVKPNLETEFQTIEKWSDLPSWLDKTVHDDDIFVLISAREGSLSWRPALDRLPRVVAQIYPELSFITVYPSEAETDSGGLSQGMNLKLLDQDRIYLTDTGENIEQVLIEMLKTEVSVDKKDIEQLVFKLLNSSRDYSPELMSGVVLYDAHTSLVSKQMLIKGIVRNGFQVPKTASKAHVVLLLLSPKEMRVRDHLKGVNTVARLIRPGESLERLKNVDTKDEIYSILFKQ
ncbi:cation:proton antiporter domain-containing protein [Rhodohalobacter sulfatireducens]|uniref:Cation:proton antiporter n=1 Tax=Rhodohalobacter sulfatireducens TaxID=2911366 RepID=A0ABS9K9A9_9BACT|nr:cation:proton antiporter [Rhodohalobacter sulfatireducens]MCG2587430.1 cation:proton antiporter [Rhodohalobacter sulfatireducens]